MKLTSKSRVAVTALADILHRSNNEYVSLSEISYRQNISLSFLEQLFHKLKKNNIVSSNRGVNGGYKLVIDPSQISIFDIIDAVEEKIDTTSSITEDSTCLYDPLEGAHSIEISVFSFSSFAVNCKFKNN